MIYFKKHENNSINSKQNFNIYFFKFLLFFFLLIIFFILKNNKSSLSSHSYFSCFISSAKLENRYIRELIEYYKKLGINKFYIGDNNSINDERLSDVLKDYISKGYIEIINIRGKILSQDYFFYILLIYINQNVNG